MLENELFIRTRIWAQIEPELMEMRLTKLLLVDFQIFHIKAYAGFHINELIIFATFILLDNLMESIFFFWLKAKDHKADLMNF